MPPLFSFLKNSKNDDRRNHETSTLQSHALQDMGNVGSKRKLKKPGPNRIVTNISNSNLVEPPTLNSSQPSKFASHHDPETHSTRRMQQDLRQRPTFPPAYSPSHGQDEPSNHPQLANSIISGHFLSEGSRYPQFTPSQARSFTVPSVHRSSFPEAQTYDEQIEDESWVNNRTQSSHNLAAQMRDPRISGAPTGATIGQDETFYEHEPSGEQPTHMWGHEAGDVPFGMPKMDENAARRQGSQHSNRPQKTNKTLSMGQGSLYSNRPEEIDEIVTRRLGSQRSNLPPKSNESVASRQGSLRSNRPQEGEENVTSRHGSQRSNRPQKSDGFVASRQGSLRSNRPQENEELVTRRLRSQRSNRPQELYELTPSKQGSIRSNQSRRSENVVTRRLGSQRSNRPQETHEFIPSRQGSLRSNRPRPQETNDMVTRRLGSQRSNRPQETHDVVPSRQGSLRSTRPQEFDDAVTRRLGSQRSRRAQTIDESVVRRQGSLRSNLSRGVEEMVARRQRSQWAQPPETIEPDVFERDYGTEYDYEPEIYNYIVPAGLNVVFQDEDGNIITRVGRKSIPYETNRPVRSAPIIVHDEFGRELYRTTQLSSPPKLRPDLFNTHVKNGPTWDDYGFGSGGRIGTHDSGQHHRPPWLSISPRSMTSWKSTKTIMVDEKGNQMVVKLPSINREGARPTEPPFHDISYHAQIDHT